MRQHMSEFHQAPESESPGPTPRPALGDLCQWGFRLAGKQQETPREVDFSLFYKCARAGSSGLVQSSVPSSLLCCLVLRVSDRPQLSRAHYSTMEGQREEGRAEGSSQLSLNKAPPNYPQHLFLAATSHTELQGSLGLWVATHPADLSSPRGSENRYRERAVSTTLPVYS